MGNLSGKVALVTGASRGVGRGIALGLGEAGATVYVTGRTSRAGASPGGLGDTLQTVADEVTHAGGQGIAVILDVVLRPHGRRAESRPVRADP